MEQLTGVTAVVLLVVTFACLFLVAANEVRKNHAKKKAAGTGAPSAPASPQLPERVGPADPLRKEAPVVAREIA